MSRGAVDLEKVRVALRRLSHSDLLLIAERAIESASRSKLRELVGDLVELEKMKPERRGTSALLAEVRTFHGAALRGDYYESFAVNSKNYMQRSRGTDQFISEFDQLMGKCLRAAEKAPSARVREALELLLELISAIDDDSDFVIFFADEGGSWQLGVDWSEVFPVYFRCVAATASDQEFALVVDGAIAQFAPHERPRHLASARRVASYAQKGALRTVLESRQRESAPRLRD